jgi:16S rRNA (cytosine967-C5)-methyltransferase
MEDSGRRDAGARRLAWEVLYRTQRHGAYPDLLLAAQLDRAPGLPRPDRALAQELVMGTLRWQASLDRALGQVSSRPLSRVPGKLLAALRMGAYQILFLERIPIPAAVNETVELVRELGLGYATGFVNGVLRSLAAHGKSLLWVDPSLPEPERTAMETSHPRWMVERWIQQWGIQEARALCVANNQVPPLTLRTNTLKVSREELLEALRAEGVAAVPTRFSPEGVQVSRMERPLSSLGPFRKGWFQVQDEASQLVSHWLELEAGQMVLDACAAPGGKTAHVAQLLGNQGRILALDIHQERLHLLAQECRRLGIACVSIKKADLLDPKSLPQGPFHRILLDAPCSGLGVLRRHPDAKWRRTPQDISRMASMQARMLQNLSPLLAPGGILLYSVCTHTQEETEGVREAVLSKSSGLEPLVSARGLPQEAAALVGLDGFLRTFPHRHAMDGFTAFRLGLTS